MTTNFSKESTHTVDYNHLQASFHHWSWSLGGASHCRKWIDLLLYVSYLADLDHSISIFWK
jgi:hypothetical protein